MKICKILIVNSYHTNSGISLTKPAAPTYQYSRKQPANQRKQSSESEPVEVLLRGHLCKLTLVIPALRIHVINHPDRKQFQFMNRNPKLHTPQEEQWRCHLPLSRAEFF